MYIKELKIMNRHKKINGIIYTPDWIVDLILDKLGYTNKIDNKRIIDPSCGEGAFLKIIVKRFLNSVLSKYSKSDIKKLLAENIFGWDIDENAIEKCRMNLDTVAEEYGVFGVNWNLKCVDSLDKNLSGKYFGKFDFVVGNPPYIRIQNLGKARRKKLQREWRFCRTGSTDIFIAFFELGLCLLNENGKLGYITPNTFLKTSAAKELRVFIKQNKMLETIIDFEHHQIFEGATTYSLISILSRGKTRRYFHLYKGNAERRIKFIDKIELGNLDDKNWILQPNDVLKRIKFIENRGLPLGKIAEVHVGITTLADDYYIFQNPVFDDNIAVITLKNGDNFEIERGILKPIVKASTLKHPDEEQNRFIIFPYKKFNGKHTIIPENELKYYFPLTYMYFSKIKDVLLSRDKGRANPVSWYAFGRAQGLDTSFGRKILTSPMNVEPKFIVWEKEEYTFYAGYCIKFNGNLYKLAQELNSEDMKFYIEHTSRHYQNGYKSYSKTFIIHFGIDNPELISEYLKNKITLFRN